MRLFPQSIIGSNRRIAALFVATALIYLAVFSWMFVRSRTWLTSNTRLVRMESTTEDLYRSLEETELALAHYLLEVPVRSLGFVREYHPLKTRLKKLQQRNRANADRLLKLGHGPHLASLRSLRSTLDELQRDIDDLLQHRRDARAVRATLDDIEIHLFRLKRAVQRLQRDHRHARGRNTARLTATLYYNLGFLVLLALVAGFLVWTTLDFNRRVKRKIQRLQKNLPSARDPRNIAPIEYTEDDELQPVVTTLNRLMQDISERTSELDATKNYLANIIESSPTMLVSIRGDGTVTNWNLATVEHTGVDADDALGRPVWEAHPLFGRYRREVRNVVRRRMRMRRERERIAGEGGASSEEERCVNVTIFPLAAGGVDGAVIMVEDITEFERQERQLRQAQRMELIGNLAGGLAHDFNNVIGGIVGSVGLIQHKLRQPEGLSNERLIRLLDGVQTVTERAEKMVQQLLTLARQGDLSLEPVNLVESARNVQLICESTFDRQVQLDFAFPDQAAVVEADPTQVEQVLLNLCINGAHAMTLMRPSDAPKGGVLRLRMERIYADKLFCESHSEAREGRYWVVKVSDEGVGMDRRTLSRIFDPFFSTKVKGKGTGLGLAMVYNIVKQHRGFLDVYSEPGVGTTFNLFLPERRRTQPTPTPPSPDDVLEPGSGVVLVVDDDETMRHIAAQILSEAGYEPLVAEHGARALELFEARRDAIAAVLLDLQMPEMDGVEVFERLRALDASCRILVTSGYAADERLRALLERGADGFIEKPYSLGRLSRKVAEVLRREREAT